MTIKPNVSEAVAAWLEGDKHTDANNPFFREGDRLFLKYDSMEIRVDDNNKLAVSLMFGGKAFHTYAGEVAFVPGNVAVLDHLEGRVEMYLNREGNTP